MDKPEDITVPPAPSRLNPGNDLAAKGDTFFGFFQPFAAYMSAVSNFVAEKVGEVAATALSGTLPSLAGKAGQLIRVNAAATAAEFATGPQAQQSLGFQAFDNAFLGAGITSNLAIGANDFGNNARWMGAQTAEGVTCTRVGFGIDTDGLPYVDYSLFGTASTTTTFSIYHTQNSVTPAVAGQVFTGGVHAQIIAGTPPADTSTGVRVDVRGQNASGVETEPFYSGAPIRPTVQTLSTCTATLANAATAQITCGVTLRVQSGVSVNFTVRIKGLQFDRGAARLAYPFKALSAPQAQQSLGFNAFDNAFLGAGVTGNLAIGANDFGNAAAWRNTHVQDNITLTKTVGVDALGPYVDLRFFGTTTGVAANTGAYALTYIPASVSEVFTGSVIVERLASPNIGTGGIVCSVTQGSLINGGYMAESGSALSDPTIPTVVSITRTMLAGTASAAVYIYFRVPSAQTVDKTYRIRGLQLDRGPNRIVYPFKALSAAEARAAMGVQASLGFTPVQQGGGTGMLGNKVYLGWSGSELRMQVDNNDSFGGLALKSDILPRIAGANAGDVGTYAMLIQPNYTSAEIWVGNTYAGSSLAYFGFLNGGSTPYINGFGNTPVGTWRAMGHVADSNGALRRGTLMLRIS